MESISLEVDTIKEYLISVGCKIEYPILVNAFKKYLYNPDPDVQGKVRTQFKDYVNRLATVSLEKNMKFIILRPEFRPTTGHLMTLGQNQSVIKETRQVSSAQVQSDDHEARNMQGRGGLRSEKVSIQPDSYASGTYQHLNHKRQHVRAQQPMQTSRFDPQHLDQMDSLHSSQSQTKHFQFIPDQLPSSQEKQPDLQQSTHPTSPQSTTNNFDGSKENITPQFPKRTPLPVPNIDSTPHIQEKSLPTAPQFHSRTQSQPAPNRDNFHQQQQYAYAPDQMTNSPLVLANRNVSSSSHLHDDSAFLMPPPPPPHNNLSSGHHFTSSPLQRPVAGARQDTPTIARTPSVASQQVPPPKPPPRRRQSTASLFKPSSAKPIEKISRDSSQDRARKSLVGRVRDHASRFNSSASTGDLSSLMPKRNSSMKENRLSGESIFGGLTSCLQRNGSQTRSRSSHRGEDESDSSSLQPIDPLRRKWAIEACNCNYNNLIALLREDPKLASCKDIVNGYTALHWAAKFGNLNIIKLIAGTHQVPVDTKSSGGHTPLHVAYMFKRHEVAQLLTASYQANENVRDHSGKKPRHYLDRS